MASQIACLGKKTIQHKKEEIRPRTLEGEHIPLQPKGKKKRKRKELKK
jgi:hypothetical protein